MHSTRHSVARKSRPTPFLLLTFGLSLCSFVVTANGQSPTWTPEHHFRFVLDVDSRGRDRSFSPASVEISFQSLLTNGRTFDEHSVEVIAYDEAGQPRVFDNTRESLERFRVPHRLDRLFGSDLITLNFVIADHTHTVLSAREPIQFGGQAVRYVRPNLGSFVDWDRDGLRDLIGCHFENSIRFYRNRGSKSSVGPAQFGDPEGVVILTGSSPQMISGADAIDWNRDGDLDLLTQTWNANLPFFQSNSVLELVL